jgi:hypothetical protein
VLSSCALSAPAHARTAPKTNTKDFMTTLSLSFS